MDPQVYNSWGEEIGSTSRDKVSIDIPLAKIQRRVEENQLPIAEAVLLDRQKPLGKSHGLSVESVPLSLRRFEETCLENEKTRSALEEPALKRQKKEVGKGVLDSSVRPSSLVKVVVRQPSKLRSLVQPLKRNRGSLASSSKDICTTAVEVSRVAPRPHSPVTGSYDDEVLKQQAKHRLLQKLLATRRAAPPPKLIDARDAESPSPLRTTLIALVMRRLQGRTPIKEVEEKKNDDNIQRLPIEHAIRTAQLGSRESSTLGGPSEGAFHSTRAVRAFFNQQGNVTIRNFFSNPVVMARIRTMVHQSAVASLRRLPTTHRKFSASNPASVIPRQMKQEGESKAMPSSVNIPPEPLSLEEQVQKCKRKTLLLQKLVKNAKKREPCRPGLVRDAMRAKLISKLRHTMATMGQGAAESAGNPPSTRRGQQR